MSQIEFNQVAKIKVFGIGGGGCNAVSRMVEEGVQGVEFYVVNTDLQVLQASPVANKIILGNLGAGANPEVGRRAAEENEEGRFPAGSGQTSPRFQTLPGGTADLPTGGKMHRYV